MARMDQAKGFLLPPNNSNLVQFLLKKVYQHFSYDTILKASFTGVLFFSGVRFPIAQSLLP